MTQAIVFVGPTLPDLADKTEFEPWVEFRPPARQGDLYLAARSRPPAIGLIDGFFEDVPSVWHKEILWALKEGVQVFGAASLGALRAAELEPFGMRGVGLIYRCFARGILEDDDEVAQVHAPEGMSFLPLSEAMVNIRRSLANARKQDIISERTANLVCSVAKSNYFKERSWRDIIQASKAKATALALGDTKKPGVLASAGDVATRAYSTEDIVAEIDALQLHLESVRVDQKQRDAIALLHAVKDAVLCKVRPSAPNFEFEHTSLWELLKDAGSRQKETDNPGAAEEGLLSNSGFIAGDAVSSSLALARILSVDAADRLGISVSEREVDAAVSQFLRARELTETHEFSEWCRARDVTEEKIRKVIEDQLKFEWVLEKLYSVVERYRKDLKVLFVEKT